MCQPGAPCSTRLRSVWLSCDSQELQMPRSSPQPHSPHSPPSAGTCYTHCWHSTPATTCISSAGMVHTYATTNLLLSYCTTLPTKAADGQAHADYRSSHVSFCPLNEGQGILHSPCSSTGCAEEPHTLQSQQEHKFFSYCSRSTEGYQWITSYLKYM